MNAITSPAAPSSTPSSEEQQFDFPTEFQSKVAALIARDTGFAQKTADIINPSYFTEVAMGQVVRIFQDHVRTYRQVPDRSMISTIIKDEVAAKRIRADQIKEVKDALKCVLTADLSNPGYVTQKVDAFAKRMAIEQAMMEALPLLEKGQFDKISELMKKATSVGVSSEGEIYDYFGEISNRTQKRKDILAGKLVRNGITTGYSELDALLYHYGWGRKELSCMMGPAKAGKSMSLGDFAKNASMAGYNTYYDSLEVSKDIIAERIDASLSSVMMRDLHKSHQDVENAVNKINARSGRFVMADHPSGTLKPSQLARQIERFRAEGIILDLCVVDYADIMAAEYRSDNLIDNLRSIYIDLRALAHEYNVAMLTATQTNREGAKAATAKATDVGDDWNKARTVDIMIGIAATEAEKQVGEARLAWLLSRNTEDGFQIRIKQNRGKMQFIEKVLGRV